jgi:porphobilinogen synthase
MRSLVSENQLLLSDLIYPIFIEENLDERTPINSLPGVYRETEKSFINQIEKATSLGINTFMLFGVSHNKDSIGSDTLKSSGLLYRMIDNAKNNFPDSLIMADLCFCEYTDHGHCGPLNDYGDVDNDATIENLGQQAIIAAQAGADIVAPSGMMDGMVYSIRKSLDEQGYLNTPILSYAVKYSSAFYGPFREAAGCSLDKYKGALKDRKTYQMDPANSNEAFKEVEADLHEGADMIMVKPGLPYLDIISKMKSHFNVPTFAYNVSGEYAMLKFASLADALDYNLCLMEMLLSFKRAGADGILTYAALDAAELLQK